MDISRLKELASIEVKRDALMASLTDAEKRVYEKAAKKPAKAVKKPIKKAKISPVSENDYAESMGYGDPDAKYPAKVQMHRKGFPLKIHPENMKPLHAFKVDQHIGSEHMKEMKKHKAEPYNLGNSAGSDFITSKTSNGHLLSEYNPKTGEVEHEWD